MSDRTETVLAAIDETLAGADEDLYVSGDAMRWSPPKEQQQRAELPQVEWAAIRQAVLRRVQEGMDGPVYDHLPPDTTGFEQAYRESFAGQVQALNEQINEAMRAAATRMQREALDFSEPEPPSGEEFRARALDARRNRNTGPSRPDNRRWSNT